MRLLHFAAAVCDFGCLIVGLKVPGRNVVGGAVEPLQAGDPRQVGAYRLLSKLGAGGMGQVFLGESPGGRKVAVKLLLPQYAADAPATTTAAPTCGTSPATP